MDWAQGITDILGKGIDGWVDMERSQNFAANSTQMTAPGGGIAGQPVFAGMSQQTLMIVGAVVAVLVLVLALKK